MKIGISTTSRQEENEKKESGILQKRGKNLDKIETSASAAAMMMLEPGQGSKKGTPIEVKP
jgi:hypothetical protein